MREACWLGIVVLAIVPACGGGPTLQGRVYRDQEASYRIGELSGDWRQLELADQNDLAFYSDSLSAIMQVNARCDPGSDVPLTALTNHLMIGFTERDIRDQRVVPMDGREALRTYLTARLDGVARELVLYVMKKDYCVYDFALIAAPGPQAGRAMSEFDRFVAGFTTQP